MSDASTATAQLPLYEGLFLMSATAGADIEQSLALVKEILDRAEAQVLVLTKWDERKLAYPIKGQKRGLYILAYFRARPTQIANIDRDCNLSENIVRSLILAAPHIGEVELKLAEEGVKNTAAEASLRKEGEEDQTEEPSEESSETATADAE
ncbi:MAG: 30S ribosomal protein S6 [Phycisphaera sp.]|nr:30S ribosomal protein S6 [Phycisphaera sp.]